MNCYNYLCNCNYLLLIVIVITYATSISVIQELVPYITQMMVVLVMQVLSIEGQGMEKEEREKQMGYSEAGKNLIPARNHTVLQGLVAGPACVYLNQATR